MSLLPNGPWCASFGGFAIACNPKPMEDDMRAEPLSISRRDGKAWLDNSSWPQRIEVDRKVIETIRLGETMHATLDDAGRVLRFELANGSATYLRSPGASDALVWVGDLSQWGLEQNGLKTAGISTPYHEGNILDGFGE